MTPLHSPCVCVQDSARECGYNEDRKQQSQEGDVSTNEHTNNKRQFLRCCCFVMSHNDVSYCKKTNVLTLDLTHENRGGLA